MILGRLRYSGSLESPHFLGLSTAPSQPQLASGVHPRLPKSTLVPPTGTVLHTFSPLESPGYWLMEIDLPSPFSRRENGSSERSKAIILKQLKKERD